MKRTLVRTTACAMTCSATVPLTTKRIAAKRPICASRTVHRTESPSLAYRQRTQVPDAPLPAMRRVASPDGSPQGLQSVAEADQKRRCQHRNRDYDACQRHSPGGHQSSPLCRAEQDEAELAALRQGE